MTAHSPRSPHSRKDVMRALPRRDLPLVAAVLRAARGSGAAVYLVGGPVRDLLLERPLRDVDLLVVPSEGGELAAGELARAAAPEGAQVTLHERFGTVTLSAGDAAIDLASARTERYARPGALPEVQPGTLEEDLRRRDFSVNALALRLSGPVRRGEPELVDADDGLRDLEARRLRILHRRSFHDDPTRALRAARLAPRLGFALSRGSRSALRDALRDGAFGAVSGDRLRREVEKLFDDVHLGLDPAAALRRLAEWHVLPALEPGLDLPRESAAPLRRLGRAIASPPWSGPRWRAWSAGLCTWLAPLAPDLRRRTLRRFSVRGELERRVAGFPRLRDATLTGLSGARGRGAVDAALGELDEERLYALYAWSPPAIRRRILRWAAEDRTRRPPVTGADLVAAGLSGPSVGRALARVRSAYLDGAVANREEAIALARELERRRPRPGRRKR